MEGVSSGVFCELGLLGGYGVRRFCGRFRVFFVVVEAEGEVSSCSCDRMGVS